MIQWFALLCNFAAISWRCIAGISAVSVTISLKFQIELILTFLARSQQHQEVEGIDSFLCVFRYRFRLYRFCGKLQFRLVRIGSGSLCVCKYLFCRCAEFALQNL